MATFPTFSTGRRTSREVNRELNDINMLLGQIEEQVDDKTLKLLDEIPENDLRSEAEIPSAFTEAQIWMCTLCGALRQWGLRFPLYRHAKPLLKCSCCRQPMRHRFAGVMSRFA